MNVDPGQADAILVARVLAGEKQAFIALVNEYQRLVSHLVFRLIPDAWDREEVCQDVFVRVHQKLNTFRFESKLGTWISRIAFNTALNFIKIRRPVLQPFDNEPEFQAAGPGELDDERRLIELVHRRMGGLSVEEKSILTFHHLEGMSVTEISEIMGRPEGTIKSDLFRARKRLKDELEDLL